MQKKSQKNIFYIIISLLFILTPPISAMLFCLKDGRMVSDIYIPLGGWSDEITYYKQIEGILAYGLPRGYFGYNQSRALYGPFGAWGLIPLIPYVIWGMFCGWGYCTPIYANIFFSVLALCAVFFFLRPKMQSMLAFLLFWIVNPFLNRYVLSGVVEASVIMQLTFVFVSGEYLLSDRIRTNGNRTFSRAKDTAALIFCTLFICFLTLTRPYYGALFLIPFWKCLRDRRKTGMILLPALAVAVVVGFFLNSHLFCSSYFSDIFSFDSLLSAGIPGFFHKLFLTLVEIARLIWYAIRYPGVGIGWYYLLLGIELLAMIFICAYRKIHKTKISAVLAISLTSNCLILLSIIELYDLGGGARHILALTVVNAILLIAESHAFWGIPLVLTCLFSLLHTGSVEELPYRDTAYAAYMDSLKEHFAEIIQVTPALSYDNVVAMPTDDICLADPDRHCSTYYGLMYALPAGVGVSLDFRDYYDAPADIRAGYILAHPEGSIRKKLESIGMECLFEDDTLALYGR